MNIPEICNPVDSSMVPKALDFISFSTPSSPTALAFREKEILNHGTTYHSEGFGSPIGKLKGINLAIEDMSPRDLEAYDIFEGKVVTLEFEGDITVSGEIVTGMRNFQGEIVLIQFKNCTVKHLDTILFDPSWGTYDMAIGKKVVSAFSGPADINSFDLITHVPKTTTIKPKISESRLALEKMYQQIRDYREKDIEVNVEDILAQLKKTINVEQNSERDDDQ